MKTKVIKFIKLVHTPRVLRLKKAIERIIRPVRNSTRLNFDDYFKNNLFKGAESVSGEGSSMTQTRVLREELPKILKRYEVVSLLDIPCGDWNWMKDLNLRGINYTGADVVEGIVKRNQEKFGTDFKFLHLNLIESNLPKVDAIFCRDCLVHLNLHDGLQALKNIKRSGSKYLLMTTFTKTKKNSDLLDGDVWRPLNMNMGPFNLPEPIYVLNEDCTEAKGKFKDKCIGVWRIDDIQI